MGYDILSSQSILGWYYLKESEVEGPFLGVIEYDRPNFFFLLRVKNRQMKVSFQMYLILPLKQVTKFFTLVSSRKSYKHTQTCQKR